MANRHRSALIWLAITAVAFASLARAQAGIQTATAYANPVFEFLAAHQNAEIIAKAAGPRLLQRAASRQTNAPVGTEAGTWAAMLPVLFVGLVSPLSLVSARSLFCLGRAPSAPALPFLFQRPPPYLLL